MTDPTPIKQQINEIVNVIVRTKINLNTVQENLKTSCVLEEIEQLEQIYSKIMGEQKDTFRKLDELLDTIAK